MINSVAVIDKNGTPLMPTTSYRARKLLKKRRAEINKYRPVFTIRLLDRDDGQVQPVEYKCDTGYQHIGISVCSEKHEYLNRQYDTLEKETEHHNNCRKYRRTRRNRKRYRQARFNNRKGMICQDGFAPSIRHKRDLHVDLFRQIADVMPITSAVFEMGQFDIQVLKAVESGQPVPEGTDYQHGERYGYETLREAVFARDNYKCVVCKKSAIKKDTILRVHHLGYKKGDRTNRMNNLVSVCTNCHTSTNHAPGGALYELKPKLKSFKGATFMTSVRFDMLRKLIESRPDIEFHKTYGAATKEARKYLGVKKTHSNDAYCMGEYHPVHRAHFEHFMKRRRNNRSLTRFYDAQYIDIRDGEKKAGKQLSCNRTNRKESRMSDKNKRIYHGKKVTAGSWSTRKVRYPFQPGDVVLVNGHKNTVVGAHCNGTRVTLQNNKSVAVKNITSVVHCNGWEKLLKKRGTV